MVTLGNIKNSKKLIEYTCENCYFNTSNKNDYSRHLLTKKHQQVTLGNNSNKKTSKNSDFYCVNCGKEYRSRKGLWQHNKLCLPVTQPIDKDKEQTDKVEELTEIIKCLVKDNSEIKNLVMIQQNTITDLVKNGTHNTTITNSHNNNKTFNLQFFLNETCKNAMNLSDFIESLQIDYDDFEKLGEIGFVNGISNIIIKSLKELDITLRPVHCTDKKREVLYVKEENIWQKEDEKYLKIRKFIKKIAYKNTRMLYKFKEKYPDYNKSESPNSDRYDLLVIETMGGRGDNDLEKETKILKNIAKEVFVNKPE
jgi:predicted RNA-binding Zn-ribbon protein involved in translation (DUF1610 family)